MRGIVSLIALSVVLPPCCGCQLDTPNLAHPGTEANQQARAKVFEPYPDNEMGPPVVGGRPREYQDPRPSFAILQDMHPNRAAGPQPGEPLATCPQPQVLQTPIAQPQIITPPPAIYTPPPAIYYPPGVTQP